PVVLERHPDLGVVRLDRVLTRPGQEPHDPDELEDPEHQREAELDRERRRRGQEREGRREDRDRAVQDDEGREQREDRQQAPQVLVPDEAQVRGERAHAPHRKFTIWLSVTWTTRLMVIGTPAVVRPLMTISVAERGPSCIVARVSTDVTPCMFRRWSSPASSR